MSLREIVDGTGSKEFRERRKRSGGRRRLATAARTAIGRRACTSCVLGVDTENVIMA